MQGDHGRAFRDRALLTWEHRRAEAALFDTGVSLPRRPVSSPRPLSVVDEEGERQDPDRVLTEEQFNRYRGWIDNSHRLHELVAELEQLSAVAMAHEAAWPEPEAPDPDRRRNRGTHVPTKQVGKRRAKAGK